MIFSYGLTDQGCHRDRNEDRILVEPDIGLFVVADGMGGQQSGERASEVAVQSVKNFFQATAGRREITWPFGYDANVPLTHNLMATAIKLANRRIWRESESNPEYTGMGSTIVAVYILGNQVTVGSVGDSRLYHHRGGLLSPMTKDDSLIARLVESGAITPAEAASHPMKNVLTEAAGAKENIHVQVREICLQSGDRLMLCSDGVHGVIDEAALRRIMDSGKDPQATVETIIAEARERGGPDNISCIITEFQND